MELELVKVKKPKEANIIIGQAHFIKTVEDLYEALVGGAPSIKFGIGFCESSGSCLVRCEGNDDQLKKIATKVALSIGAGHCFVVIIDKAYPINVLNAIKSIPEVCSIFCATANPVEVVIAKSEQGRGILGIIDGAKPKGMEKEEDINWRKNLLRKIGYKL